MCPHCNAETMTLSLGFGQCYRTWDECPECGWVGPTDVFGCGGYSADEHQSCAPPVQDGCVPATDTFCASCGDDPCSCPQEGDHSW